MIYTARAPDKTREYNQLHIQWIQIHVLLCKP